MKESINSNNFSPRCLNVLALLALLLATGGGNALRAQDADPREQMPEARRVQQAQRGAGGGGLLRALNLSPEQRTQIKAIRRETESQGRLLGARLRQARRALDEAIYADNPDDALIEARVREVGAAQTTVLRMRTLTELKIRRVLTPEQLEAFRRMQRRPRARQPRINQTPSPGDLPDDADFAPEPRRNRARRRL